MRSRIFLPVATVVFALVISVFGCTKFDTTTLGTDIIPAVDNVNTFADTFSINANQVSGADSTSFYRSDNFPLGYISNDPIFGTTKADVYAQFKPTFYPYYFANPGDTLLGLDSVVLCLSYKGAWGDTTKEQTFDVYQVQDPMFRDSTAKQFNTAYEPNTSLQLLGSKTLNPAALNQQIKISKGKDSVSNQIRIKLNMGTFASLLYNSDTVTFKNDSSFRNKFNGLAIKTRSNSPSNALLYVNLLDATTRLEVHFKKTRNGVKDTVFNSLSVATDGGFVPQSSYADHIERNRAGTPSEVATTLYNYIQTSPGTYLNLVIPSLDTFKNTNRIIHRATLIVEQIPGDPASDSLFTAPPYLYVDLKDTSSATPKFKPVYFDLNPSSFYSPDNSQIYFPTAGVDQAYYGGFVKRKTVPALGNRSISYYNLNITRYLQQMVTTQKINYGLRLFAPVKIQYPQYGNLNLPYSNPPAFGRIRLGGSAHPTNRIRLAVIYSKIS